VNVKVLVAVAAALVFAVPAQAGSGGISGIVVARHGHGTIVLARAGTLGVTVHTAGAQKLRLGDRVRLQGTQLANGTIRASRIRVFAHEDDVAPVAQAGNVRVEGSVVSTSPFVVSIGGLPITITVPAAMTLPAGLAAGQKIELTVAIGTTANTFTLVSIDDNNLGAVNDEVEVRGSVVSASATQLVVSSGGTTSTFTVPTGMTLPALAPGTIVEARGHMVNGVLTLDRVKVEDENDDNGGAANADDDDAPAGTTTPTTPAPSPAPPATHSHDGGDDGGHGGDGGGHDGGHGGGGGD
jgi:uncharacterized protein DUF5666